MRFMKYIYPLVILVATFFSTSLLVPFPSSVMATTDIETERSEPPVNRPPIMPPLKSKWLGSIYWWPVQATGIYIIFLPYRHACFDISDRNAWQRRQVFCFSYRQMWWLWESIWPPKYCYSWDWPCYKSRACFWQIAIHVCYFLCWRDPEKITR